MFLRPRTLDEACEALAAGDARILSGGTDLYPAHAERPLPPRLVDLSRLDELAGITVNPDHICLGGRTCWLSVARAELPPAFDALKAAAREVGSIQIQSVATVAGNLCNASPAADGVPPLLALDAEVELTSKAGGRRLPLSQFLLGNRRTALRPDEIMTAIRIPRTIDEAGSTFLKLGARKYLVISIAMVAAIIEAGEDKRVRQARIAVGACSPVARRLTALETALVGAPARPGLGTMVEDRLVEGLEPIDDLRATADYRGDVVLTLLRRAIDDAAARA